MLEYVYSKYLIPIKAPPGVANLTEKLIGDCARY